MKKTLKKKTPSFTLKKPHRRFGSVAVQRQLASAEMLPTRRRGNFKTVKKWRPGRWKTLSYWDFGLRILSGETVGDVGGLGQQTK